MRWESKTSEMKLTRWRRLFAWLPMEAEDGFTYWLEWLQVEERFIPSDFPLMNPWHRMRTIKQ